MELELICRTCLSNISMGVFITPTILNMITSCAPVQISLDDGLPRKICENCMKLLQISFIFRRRILTVAAKLEDYLQKKLVSMPYGPYHQQPDNKGYVEQPVFPSLKEKDIGELLSLNKMLQTVDTDFDPLLIDPLNIAKVEETYFETDAEDQVEPIEEVMLPISTNNVSTTETIESLCTTTCLSMPTTTEQKQRDSSIFSQNTVDSNPLPLLCPINKPVDMQQYSTYSENIEHNPNVLNLKENDFNFIQNLVQSNVNVECILIQRNSTNLPNTKKVKHRKLNQKVINTIQQTNILPKIFPKPSGNQSFDEELKKFIEEREQYLEDQGASIERKNKNCEDEIRDCRILKKVAVDTEYMKIPALVYYKDKIKNKLT